MNTEIEQITRTLSSVFSTCELAIAGQHDGHRLGDVETRFDHLTRTISVNAEIELPEPDMRVRVIIATLPT